MSREATLTLHSSDSADSCSALIRGRLLSGCPVRKFCFFSLFATTSSHILDARALGLARERTEEGARESSGFEALTKMSSQDAKNKETESKIMGAAEAVTALIDAVTKENADGVRAAAERFKKDTKSDINSLGDANGRTPMHLVRAHIFPQTRRSETAALSKRTARAPRATAAAARSREKNPRLFATSKRERRENDDR